jgi:hypothetical protein
VRITAFRAEMPRNAVITAACAPRGCAAFRRVARGPAKIHTIRLTTLVDRFFPNGVRIHILVQLPNIGKAYEYRIVKGELRRVRGERCRPRGSIVAPADVPARCP